MMNRQLLAVALLLAAIGCKDSKPAASSQAAPAPKPNQSASASTSAKPVTVVAKAMPHAAPPPMETMVPARTFELNPPASFGDSKISAGSAVEFMLKGDASRFLVVDTREISRVSAQASDNGSRKLTLGYDSKGRWFYALPQTGTYRILYAPVGTPAIKFSWLAANDSITDPGVKPEQISVDFGAFAQKEELGIAPFTLDDEGEFYWESWPTHLAVAHNDFEFRIMTVAGNKGVFKKEERMTALETALQPRGKNSDVRALPYPVYGDGGLNLWTKPEFLEGDGWRGLRWIAGFAQDISCSWEMGGQQLGYYFEGISNDGRYFVLVRAQVTSPALSRQFGKDCAAAEAETRNPDLNAVFQKDMVRVPRASFHPNLDQLDAVIRSLKFKQ